MADVPRGHAGNSARFEEQTTFAAVLQSMLDSNGRYRPRKVCVEDMTRNKPKSVSQDPKATLNEKLDEALDKSFPASDPVAVGHSEHVGRPKPKRPKDVWPKGAVGLKAKRQ